MRTHIMISDEMHLWVLLTFRIMIEPSMLYDGDIQATKLRNLKRERISAKSLRSGKSRDNGRHARTPLLLNSSGWQRSIP